MQRQRQLNHYASRDFINMGILLMLFTVCSSYGRILPVKSPLMPHQQNIAGHQEFEGLFALKVAPQSDGSLPITARASQDEHDHGTITQDTVYIGYGDSVEISATGVKLSDWSSLDAFVPINDSLIRVSPTQQSTYYLKSYSKLQVANENSSFELPVYSNGVKIRPQDEIPGWKTTAQDGEIEVWRNFQNIPAFEGDQFVELNANMVGDLYQDITTVPGEDIIVEFAHRGRAGLDKMGLKHGPPEGPYTTIGEYTDGTDSWGFYREVITIPVGQTRTRIFFTSNGYSSSGVGNFLDAVSYTSAQSSLDSVVVVVQYPMEVTSPLAASIHDDGDGIADSLKISFDVALDKTNRFDSVLVYWGKDSTLLTWDEFELSGNALSVWVSDQQFSEGIYTGKQDEGDQLKLTFYYSDQVNQTRVKMQKDLVLEDHVGPVILKASVLNGDKQKLIVRYSEPIKTDFGDDTDLLVLYQMKDKTGMLQEYDFTEFSYKTDSAHSEIYPLQGMIHARDSIRLHPLQGIMDLSDNRPHVDNAYVRIESYSQLTVKTAPFAYQVDAGPETPQFGIQMVDQAVSVDEYSLEINQIGARYDLDIQTYMQQYTDVDESLISVKWRMEVYTTQGGFVGQENGEVECYDGLYEGGCFYDDRSLFLSWNLRDKFDRKVGVGAYIIRVNIWLWYDNELVTKSKDLWIAGIRR